VVSSKLNRSKKPKLAKFKTFLSDQDTEEGLLMAYDD